MGVAGRRHTSLKTYMQSLELKIPPPIVTLIMAAAMWSVSLIDSSPHLSIVLRLAIGGTLAILGGSISLAGMLAFRRVRTTYSPMKPEKTSSLVATGVYRFTRNPMYVGLLVTLIAWGVLLSSALSLFGPLIFFLYIGRFQINPEERILSEIFGAEYARYSARVRRWL